MSGRGKKIAIIIAIPVVINTLLILGLAGVINKWYFYAAIIALHVVVFTITGKRIAKRARKK